jgi:hypothetical protein
VQLNNPSITMRSTSSSAAPVYTITDLVASCTLPPSRPIISRNTFGTTGQVRNKKGRHDGSFTIDFDQDYSSSAAISRVLYSYFLADYPVEIIVIADSSASASASNPKYTFQVAVDSVPIIDGDADSGATAQVTWPMHGTIVETTS